MGFLSRIFGSSNSKKEFKPAPELTSELMDEGLYWQIIQISIDESGGDPECQENVIVGELEKLKPAEMIGFRLRTDKFLYDSYCSKFWCAGYLMNGGCSDDMFEYFRLWVISKGRDVFNFAVNDPDSLVSQDQDGIEFYEFESFWYVALRSFENVTGKNLYDFIDYENFKFREGKYPNFEFDWSEEDPESMRKLCPKLFDRFYQ